MADTGTGTDPGTERCPDCGHLWERVCGCSCCGTGRDDEPVLLSEVDRAYDRQAFARDYGLRP